MGAEMGVGKIFCYVVRVVVRSPLGMHFYRRGRDVEVRLS
jgi:hypothetical protein